VRDFGPRTYGRYAADRYDERFEKMQREVPLVVDVLRGLAGDGPVLDIGVGTGRIALPLAASGLEVVGVDVSTEMLDAVRAKPGGARLRLREVDVADTPVLGSYPLVYCVFNTLFMLGPRERQARFLQHACRALAPGGRLVIEVFVPSEATLGTGRRKVNVASMTTTSVVLVAAVHRPREQLLENQEIVLDASGVRLSPAQFHYQSPEQLDELAACAGLAPAWKWSGWDRAAFAADSVNLVAGYRHFDEADRVPGAPTRTTTGT
jgi:SAM-dependent methyltransferase